MNQTKSNILANFAGKSVTAVVGVVFVPVYLEYLGVEAFGIIGFFSSVFLLLYLLDGGISPTLTREVARLSAFPEKADELRNLSRTLEILCWTIAAAACLIAFLVSPAIATYWLNPKTIPTETIRDALMLMSVTFAFQWVYGFYTGGLQALQQQWLVNSISVIGVLLRSVGTWLVLAYVSPTLTAFVLCQLITTILQAALLAIFFWRKLPPGEARARFDFGLLMNIWRYAAGLAGIGVATLIVTQTDKVILSKLLTLEDFGYYSLAVTLAGSGLSMIIGSIQTVYFPQFSRLVAQERFAELSLLYHRSCQVMSFFLIPAVCVLAAFSYEILLIWTGKAEIAQNTYVLLALVSIGTGLNGLIHLPYFAQLAHGITRIGFWQNVAAIVFLIPFMIFATLNYGAVGGAVSWVIVNLGYTLISVQVMHRMILRGELKKWYLVDVGLPLAASAVINIAAFLVWTRISSNFSILGSAVFISAVSLATLAAALFATPATREFFGRKVLRNG